MVPAPSPKLTPDGASVTMRCGFFSSDRAIADYAERIWKLTPQPIAP